MTNWRTILSWQLYHSSWDTLPENIKNILLQERYDGSLWLSNTPITNLGNLQSVGGSLWLSNTPIARMNVGERNRVLRNVEVGGRIVYE